MNIIIVGGGTPKRLGNKFGLYAQEQKHNVISISHRQHPDNTLETIVCDSVDHYSVAQAFQDAVNKLGTVDLLLYCTRNYNNSIIAQDTLDAGYLNVAEYNDTLMTDVIIPHKIALIAHKLNLHMHMVFFTTHLTLVTQPTDQIKDYKKYTTYIGGKAWQLYLMRSLSDLSTSVTASAFAVHFDWEQDNQNKVEHLYDVLINHRDKVSGKVISMLETDQILEVEVLKYAPQLIL